MGRSHCFMLPMTIERGTRQARYQRPRKHPDPYHPPVAPYPRGGVRRMRTRRVRSAALLVAAVTLVLAAGCSSSGGAAANSPRLEKPNLTVAVVPAVDSAGFFIALYGGLFTAQGLHVTFVPATSSETAIRSEEH